MNTLLVRAVLAVLSVLCLVLLSPGGTVQAAGPAVAQPGSNAQNSEVLRTALVRKLRVWASEQTSHPVEWVVVAPLDARLRIAACPEGERFSFPFAKRDMVRVDCRAPAWQVFIAIDYRAPRVGLVANRDLPAGTLLSNEDMTLRPQADESADPIEDPRRAVGHYLRRALSAGSPIEAHLLDERVLTFRTRASSKAQSLITAELVESSPIARAAAPVGAAVDLTLDEGLLTVRDLPAGHLLLASDLSASRLVVVARTDLASGRVLEAGMLEARRVSNAPTGQQFFTQVPTPGAWELARNLNAGDAIGPADVRPALLVRRGEPVQLTVGSASGLELTVLMEAQQDGRLGERISLRNPESGRQLPGIITGRGLAKAGP